jgi:hypothetical protein
MRALAESCPLVRFDPLDAGSNAGMKSIHAHAATLRIVVWVCAQIHWHGVVWVRGLEMLYRVRG